MEDIQQSQLIFYLPITACYAISCTIALTAFKHWKLKAQEDFRPQRPVLELILAILAVIAVFLIGRVYSAGFLIPSRYNPLAWIINNLIIYCPIFIMLYIRRQPSVTIWVTLENSWQKIAIGSVCSAIAVVLFIALRNELSRLPEISMKALSLDGLSNFIAIFLEGVVLAYLFIRLKWVSNLKVSLAIPAILFAIAHIPGMISDGDPWWHMVLMSIVTGSITVFVLYTCHKTKDIIWIGFVHYFLDAAINAF